MPKIFKPAGKSKFVVFYTDHNGRRRKKTLTGDRAVSERIAAKLVEDAALRKAGLVDERDERIAEHEGAPIEEHVEDFVRVTAANGATDLHVKRLGSVVRQVLKLAKVKRISDLSLSSVEEAIGKLRGRYASGTVNFYTRCVKAFSRWLWKDKRTREHILAHLAQKDVKGDRRRIRRRLTDAEVAALISAAENGPATGTGFSGPDRAMLYRLAHGTGFRAKELRTLTPERFRLDDDPPTVTVLACYSKNGQEAEQPIATALADRLKPWLAGKPLGKPVFARMNNRQSDMLRADLKAAGVPYVTSEGVADFHASRGTYISNVMDTGASIKTLQTLARHSDPRLTIGIYSKVTRHDLEAAVESLPELAPTPVEPEAMRATGTDDLSTTQKCYPNDDDDDIDSPKGLSCNDLRRENGGDATYHMYCALALLVVGALTLTGRQSAAIQVAGWSLLLGSLIFSGSLYILCVTGLRWLGAITPIGGVAILAGWIALALAAGSMAVLPPGD